MPIAEMTAKAIAVSRNTDDPNPRRKIASLLCKYPLTIHNEVMTHRAFSRNTASSRAIPVARMIQSAIDDYAEPKYWFKNKPGMQGTEPLAGMQLEDAKAEWHKARWDAIERAGNMANHFGVHKQIVNRLLGPFIHTFAIITATEWANFIRTRVHEAAEPHMRDLAIAMRDALTGATVKLIEPGAWHLPFTTDDDWIEINGGGVLMPDQMEAMIKISVARCASTSYMTVEGEPMTLEKAIALYDKLRNADPLHASPFEHQAQADVMDYQITGWGQPQWHGNFTGFIQYRKTIDGECAEE